MAWVAGPVMDSSIATCRSRLANKLASHYGGLR